MDFERDDAIRSSCALMLIHSAEVLSSKSESGAFPPCAQMSQEAATKAVAALHAVLDL